MRRRFADASSPDARAAEAALRRFAGLCEAAGVPMGIVLFPSLGRPDDFAFLHERVLAFCGEEGLPCLDLRSRFAALGGIQDLRVNRFDAHPGAAAHDAAAEAILRHFSPYW